MFCACQRGDDAREFILHRSRNWFVILNRYPYTGGHLLIVSNRHLGSLCECDDEVVVDLARLMRAAETALRGVYEPHGINAGYNAGSAAGAGIPGHFHVHLLPRWRSDTNFMTVVGDARVIPETLPQSWENLRPALAARPRRQRALMSVGRWALLLAVLVCAGSCVWWRLGSGGGTPDRTGGTAAAPLAGERRGGRVRPGRSRRSSTWPS